MAINPYQPLETVPEVIAFQDVHALRPKHRMMKADLLRAAAQQPPVLQPSMGQTLFGAKDQARKAQQAQQTRTASENRNDTPRNDSSGSRK